MKLGNRLKAMRFNSGEITQAELADNIGVTRQTIISLEKGKYIPSTLLALKIARFFQAAVEDVFFIAEEQKNEERRTADEE